MASKDIQCGRLTLNLSSLHGYLQVQMRHDATRCVARIPDAADLAALDAALSPPHLPGLTEDEIRSRLQRFPTEQLVLCTFIW